MLAEPVSLDEVRLYRQVRALRKALGMEYGSGRILAAGLRAQVVKLERAAKRAGVDWQKELGPRDEVEHLAALAKKKKPRRARVESPPE